MRATATRPEMDAAVQAVAARRNVWAALGIDERLAILDRLRADVAALGHRWVAECLAAKGLSADSPYAAEEWELGPFAVLRHLRVLRHVLADVAAYGIPRLPAPIVDPSAGRLSVRVFPQTLYDRLFFGGLTVDVWQQAGTAAGDLYALPYQDGRGEPPPAGKVALVLGTGNYLSGGVGDVLEQLFVGGQGVVFKPSPVNAGQAHLVEEGLRALIEPGFLRLVYGGAAEGTYLCQHPGIDEIHLTGSAATFEAIVFGAGPAGAAGKVDRAPLLRKRVSAELGSVSPLIVVPGPWSAADVAYQTQQAATSVVHNAGCNCNATRVIVQRAGWDQRDQFLAGLRRWLAAAPLRPAFYPGTGQRWQTFTAAHPEGERFGKPAAGQLPWALLAGLDPAARDEVCFTTEAFCGVVAETALAAGSVPAFLEAAVEFANARLWGNLCATILVHPRSLQDPATAAALERAIADLRYGTVAVNVWAAASYLTFLAPWGAFPGNSADDIQSGRGFVHNSLRFAHPEKSVLRAPFRIRPRPVWFLSRGRQAAQVFRRLADCEAAPSPWKVPAILGAALSP